MQITQLHSSLHKYRCLAQDVTHYTPRAMYAYMGGLKFTYHHYINVTVVRPSVRPMQWDVSRNDLTSSQAMLYLCWLGEPHGGRTFCIWLLAFKSLSREMASKFLGQLPHEQTRCSKCTCALLTTMGACCLHKFIICIVL